MPSNATSRSQVIVPAGINGDLLDFLSSRFPHISNDQWHARFEQGLVQRDDGSAWSSTQPATAGLRVYYFRSVEQEPVIQSPAHILFQDEHIVVADKPHWLPVTPSGKYVTQTLLHRMKQQTGLSDLSPIHRIDRDTAGLVVFSVKANERGAYQALFRDRLVHKKYWAVAPSSVAYQEAFIISNRIERAAHFMQMQQRDCSNNELPNAITRIECLEHTAGYGLYLLQPLTGQKHQLRVHMNGLGHPILNDGIYPILKPEGDNNPLKPLQLLAKQIAFKDPITGQERFFESQLNLHWPPSA